VRKLRRPLGALSLVGLVTGALLTFTAPGANAAALEKSGWWYRPNAAPGPLAGVLPPPPGTPPDGLLVQATPDGPNAVAAVSFALEEGELGGSLTLNVSSDTGGETANLQACPVTAPWQPAQGGSFDAKPKEDCEFGTAPGTRSPDGKVWTFDITALITNGRVDVVILPQALPEAGGAAPVFRPFSLGFEKPTSASLAPPVAGGSEDIGDLSIDPSSFPSGASDPSSSFSPDSGSGSVGSVGGGASDFAPSVDGVALGGAGALDAAPPPPAVAPAASGGQALATTPAADVAGLANRRGLGIGLMLLCGLAGIFLAATRSPAFAAMLPPALRPRGADGDPAEGGLGRFVRPRVGRAPAL
jgi:hypothetical protein